MKSERSVKDHIEYLHDKTRSLKARNLTEAEIIEELKQDDVDELYARTLIENIENDKSDSRNFRKELGMGIFISLGGLGINYFSYQIGAASNSFYYIFWGIVVLGISISIRAFIIFKK